MSSKKIALILMFDHPNLVVEGFSESISNSLKLFNYDSFIISITSDLSSSFSKISLTDVQLVISIGPWPLEILLDGIPIYKFFKCPVFLYLLDTPIYDFAKFSSASDFVNESITDDRLKILFSEKSYMDLYLNHFNLINKFPSFHFLPFAAFPAHNHVKQNNEVQNKLVVIGGLGTELIINGTKQSNQLKELIQLNDPYGNNNSQIDLLFSAFNDVKFYGNVAQVIIKHWSLDPSVIFTQDFLILCCAVDSYIKRNNRISIIESAIGIDIDFYGPGWINQFNGIPGFYFNNDIKHFEIAEISKNYTALLNFDPNWEFGIHDRVFTAISSGCTVITNSNFFYDNSSFNHINLLQYNINSPNIKELFSTLTTTSSINNQSIRDFTLHHSWFNRVFSMLNTL
jgi:hypothetical protein